MKQNEDLLLYDPVTDGLGPLPETEWLLFMPARPYEREFVSSQPGYDEEQLRAYAEAAVAAERERCAKLCEAMTRYASPDEYDQAAIDCAAAIRKA